MRSPNISVYITSYNQKEYLVEAIESVLCQTLKPFEIIIVDDCSTDGSQDIIEKYASKYPDLIRPFYHSHKLGIPRNRNFALKQVRGDLVTYVDGDDRYLPRKLELELETLINHPEAQIVYSNYYYLDVYGQRLSLWADPNTPQPSGDVFIDTFSNNFPRGIPFRSELVPISCMHAVGLYDERIGIYEDWDIRIRLTKLYKAVYCSEPLSEYRLNPGGISSLAPSILFDSIAQVYEKHFGYLCNLQKHERSFVENKIAIAFAGLSKSSFTKASYPNAKKLACKFYIRGILTALKNLNIKLFSELVLPRSVFVFLKKIYRYVLMFI